MGLLMGSLVLYRHIQKLQDENEDMENKYKDIKQEYESLKVNYKYLKKEYDEVFNPWGRTLMYIYIKT